MHICAKKILILSAPWGDIKMLLGKNVKNIYLKYC